MSETFLRITIASVLGLHGIGQAMGIVPALRLSLFEGKDWGWLQNWSSHSWVFTPLLGDNAARFLSMFLFAVPLLGFLGAALSLLGWAVPHHLWRPLALTSAVMSLLALGCYWNALVFLMPHKVGNIAVNAAVLIGLLWFHWPQETDLGF